MTAVQVGVIALDNATITPINIQAPRQVTQTRDAMGLSIRFETDTAAELSALIQQFRGYPNPDEPIVPIIRTGGDSWGQTGWYGIDAIDVLHGVDEGNAAQVAEVEIACRRIPGHTVPVIEDRYRGVLLDNSLAFADGSQRYTWAVPAAAYDRDGPAAGTWTTRVTESGTLAFWYDDTLAAFSDTLFYALDPEDAYIGACLLEAKLGGGSTWYAIPGRAMENLPSSWRLSNGILRATKTAGSGSIDIEWYDGVSAWESATTITLSGGTYGDLYDCYGAFPLRVGPETTTLRTLWIAEDVTTHGRLTVDLIVRRGDRTLKGIIKCDTTDTWGIRSNEAAAFNSITGGVTKSTNDASGNRVSHLTPHTVTKTLTAGAGGLCELSVAAANFVFGVGCEIGGTGSAAPNTYDGERDAFFGWVQESARVRGR